MVVVGIREPGRVEQYIADPGHQLVEELAPLGVVEERAPDRGDLHEAGECERRQCDRQRRVQVEEQLQRAELQEGRTPARRDLKWMPNKKPSGSADSPRQ